MTAAGAATAPHPADRLGYFCPSYEKCREAFREAIGAATRALPSEQRSLVESGAWKVPSASDADLTIDWVYFPARKQRQSLVIIASGVHGVEAFAGSAMQQQFLKETLPKLDRDDTGFLLVHAVNPYGFKYFRRVSEQNVDLNRNFDTDPKLFATRNPGYAQLTDLLNPTGAAAEGFFPRLRFYARAIRFLLRTKLAALRQAVMGGQYENERGLYFGGKAFEPQKALLEKELGEKLKLYRNSLVLDIHTGYGKKGVLHLFPSVSPEPAVEKATREIFNDRPIEDPHGPDFYANNGDFPTFVSQVATAMHHPSIPMCLEFGTFDNHTTLGGIESIRRMILENQAHWYGADDQTAKRLRQEFLEMYIPQSRHWRETVMEEAAKQLPLYIEKFHRLSAGLGAR